VHEDILSTKLKLGSGNFPFIYWGKNLFYYLDLVVGHKDPIGALSPTHNHLMRGSNRKKKKNHSKRRACSRPKKAKKGTKTLLLILSLEFNEHPIWRVLE